MKQTIPQKHRKTIKKILLLEYIILILYITLRNPTTNSLMAFTASTIIFIYTLKQIPTQ